MSEYEIPGNQFPKDVFVSLLGGIYDFYGVDNNVFCIGVDGVRLILEAVPDPGDGYRSYFGCFSYDASIDRPIFFREPIAKVRLTEGGRSRRGHSCFCDGNDPYDSSRPDRPCAAHAEEQRRNFTGWVLTDVESDHVWLTVGTDYGEDYYPCFMFDYQPDPNRQVQVNG